MRNILKSISTIKELNIEELNRLGLGVEIQDFTEPNLSELEIFRLIKEYKEKLKNLNGLRALHGPFLDLKPSSPDKLIRKVSYNRYLETIKIAKELNIDYIIFHSQINPYLNSPELIKLNNLQSKEFWHKILKETKDYKGIILIENIFEENPIMIKDLLDTIKLPNVRMNLDIGHAKLGKVSLEEWIKSMKDYIEYIHVHSNNGIYDEHKSPNEDEILQLYQLLDKYKIDPMISLEYKIENLTEEIKKYRI